MRLQCAQCCILLLSLSSCPALLAQDSFDLQAHRGGLGLVTESTLESFANALRLGVSTLELDVQITADGYAVVTHDRQVQAHKCRDTDPVQESDPGFPYVGKFIKDLSLAQVKTLNCGYQQLPGYPQQQVIPGASMPLLSDVFALVKKEGSSAVKLNIETKIEAGAPHETAPRHQFIDIVIAETRAAEMESRVSIQSFDWGALLMIKRLAPEIPTVALTNGQSFLQCGEPGSSPWLGGLDMDDFDCDLIAAVDSLAVSVLSPVHGNPQNGHFGDADYKPFVTQEMVVAAHARGIKVIPWTVDDEATMEYLIELGVDGIITNYPDRLRRVMARHGMALPQ